MKLEPFHLERWLLKPHRYDLASAGIPKLRLKDLTDEIDFEMVLNYGITNGSELLRSRVAALYPNINSDQVLITTGTAEANLLTMMNLITPGDEVIALSPTYQQCIGFSESFGAAVRLVDLDEENGYRIDMDRLATLITDKTKVIILVNPNNPTGSILSDVDMKEICTVASKVGAWVLCDGALRGLEVVGGKASTPVEFYEKSISTGSVSKIGLTGLRIGWLATPNNDFLMKCWSFKDYTTLSHSGIGEHLATIALQSDKLSKYLLRAHQIIQRHSEILEDWIEEHNHYIDWVPSQAGHTAFPRYHLPMDSVSLSQLLLEEEDVLVGPGDFFGKPSHLRIRYSGEEPMLREGLQRLGDFLRRHSK